MTLAGRMFSNPISARTAVPASAASRNPNVIELRFMVSASKRLALLNRTARPRFT
jgi:hypothetical protein